MTSEIFGRINHSQLLVLEAIINTNYSNIIENHKIFPLINLSSKKLINNSLGFGTIGDAYGGFSFILPLNNSVGLFISNAEEIRYNDYLLIDKGEEHKVDKINKGICLLEIEWGNGFIFGEEKSDVEYYSEYIRMKKE